MTLQPIAPLIINAVDLEWFIDVQAYSDNFLHVKVHYWTPRGGLSFVKNMGLDEPCSYPHEGRNFDASYIRTADWGGQLGTKAGVIINKDSEGHKLRLSDIIQSPFNPAPDPYVNFNKRSTIMRAASVFGPLNTPDLTSTGAWRLIDNYGTEQSYLLLTSGPEYYHELVLYDLGAIINPPPDPEPLKTRLVKFEISLPGGHIATDALYANNRHQCKVSISVILEKETATGDWERVALTTAQRDSVTVTLFSENDRQPLPVGWSCDHGKNKYDTGLWGSRIEEETGLEDVLDRYMRVAPVAIQTQRFMACITIDGDTYTTNPLESVLYATSWVIISPVRPYFLGTSELTRFEHRDAYRGTNPTVLVIVNYWTPPSGLTFVENLGLSNPVAINNEGLYFKTAVVSALLGTAKVGVVVGRDGGQSLYMNDVHRNVYADKNPKIIFDRRTTIMRAVEFSASFPAQTSTAKNYWALIDNFGCEHRYRMTYHPYGAELVVSG